MTESKSPKVKGSDLEGSGRETPFLSPSTRLEQERRGKRLLLLTLRLLFLVLLVTVSLLPFVGTLTKDQADFMFADYIGPLIATFAFGIVVLVIDASLPNKRLGTVFGVYLGIVAGLIGALAIGALIDLVAKSWNLTTDTNKAYLGLAKLVIGITLCYLAVSIVLTTKDDLRLVIPYVEFSRQVRGVRPWLLDTSVLIDGRIEQLGQTGFLAAPLIVPQFVVDELQQLSDSAEKLKRRRGRRGLEIVSHLQASPDVDVMIDRSEMTGHSVDHLLMEMASAQNLRILTTDYNLNKVAEINNLTVLNLHDLASSLKSQAIPGEYMSVEVAKPGEAEGQGVGYLPDGTMVVIEDAQTLIGESVDLIVTNSLQTQAGRIIFGKLTDEKPAGQSKLVQQMAQSATSQERSTEQPHKSTRASTTRNPRR